MVTRGKYVMDMYTLLYVKWITKRDLLYSTENFVQCYVTAWMGGKFGDDGYTYIYGLVSSVFT